LRSNLASALVNDGRQGEAGEAYLAASQGASGAAALDLKRRAAQHFLASHHVDRGLPILDEVLAAVGLRRARSNLRVVARMLFLRARLALRGFRFRLRAEEEVPAQRLARLDVCESTWVGLGLSNQLLAAAEFHTRFLGDALRAGEPRRLALGLAAEVFFSCLLGPERLRRSIKLMPVAEALAARSSDPLPRARLETVRAVIAWVGGRWGESQEILARAQEMVRQQCIGANLERQTVLYTLLCTRVYTGRISLMRSVIRQEMREAEAREDRWVALLYGASGYAAVARLGGDDVDEARRQVERAAELGHPRLGLQHLAMAIAFYCDDRPWLRRELEGLRQQWPRLVRTRLLDHPIDGVRLCDLRGRAAATLALGAPAAEKPALLREARLVAGWLDRRPAPWAMPHAALLRAVIAAAESDRGARHRPARTVRRRLHRRRAAHARRHRPPPPGRAHRRRRPPGRGSRVVRARGDPRPRPLRQHLRAVAGLSQPGSDRKRVLNGTSARLITRPIRLSISAWPRRSSALRARRVSARS
jgi:hypothetical protein